jgi:hypothetical protein
MTVGTKNVPGQRNIRKIHRGTGSFVSTFRLFRTNEFWRLPAGAEDSPGIWPLRALARLVRIFHTLL